MGDEYTRKRIAGHRILLELMNSLFQKDENVIVLLTYTDFDLEQSMS